MSKAKEKYYKLKAESDAHFGGLQNDITDYVMELEGGWAYNRCLALEKRLLELEQQNRGLIIYIEEVVFALEMYQTEKDWDALKKAGLKLIEKNWGVTDGL